MFESKNIGIIGIKGRFGRWLERFFSEKGCVVIGSDIGVDDGQNVISALSLQEVVEKSDVVIFCVPILSVVSVIEEANSFSRAGQLFLDITSLKVPAIEAMLQSKAEVVGMHPLFAPPEAPTWKNGTLIVCRSRIDTWTEWFDGFLSATEATIKTIDPKEHDSLMLAEQNLIHLQSFVSADVMKKMKLDPSELIELGTRLSKKQFGIFARILAQKNPELYAEIQIGNPGTLSMIDGLISVLGEYRAAIASKDVAALTERFRDIQKYFGDEFISTATDFLDH